VLTDTLLAAKFAIESLWKASSDTKAPSDARAPLLESAFAPQRTATTVAARLSSQIMLDQLLGAGSCEANAVGQEIEVGSSIDKASERQDSTARSIRNGQTMAIGMSAWKREKVVDVKHPLSLFGNSLDDIRKGNSLLKFIRQEMPS
jgi:hypothetical protein